MHSMFTKMSSTDFPVVNEREEMNHIIGDVLKNEKKLDFG